METQALNPSQVIARFGWHIELLSRIEDDKLGRPVTINAMTVGRDSEQRQTIELHLASAAYQPPIKKRLDEICSPTSNARHTPLATALRMLPPIKYVIPHQG